MAIPDKDWLIGWQDPYNDDLDRELFDPWREMRRLPKEGWESLAKWKFNRDGRRRNAVLRGIADFDENLAMLPEKALEFTGDWYPLRIITIPKGTGPAMGSAVLACAAPDRFSLYDVNALRSANAFEPSIGGQATLGNYAPYMKWVRRVAREHSMRLREVDKALFSAGRTMKAGDAVPDPPAS